MKRKMSMLLAIILVTTSFIGCNQTPETPITTTTSPTVDGSTQDDILDESELSPTNRRIQASNIMPVINFNQEAVLSRFSDIIANATKSETPLASPSGGMGFNLDLVINGDNGITIQNYTMNSGVLIHTLDTGEMDYYLLDSENDDFNFVYNLCTDYFNQTDEVVSNEIGFEDILAINVSPILSTTNQDVITRLEDIVSNATKTEIPPENPSGSMEFNFNFVVNQDGATFVENYTMNSGVLLHTLDTGDIEYYKLEPTLGDFDYIFEFANSYFIPSIPLDSVATDDVADSADDDVATDTATTNDIATTNSVATNETTTTDTTKNPSTPKVEVEVDKAPASTSVPTTDHIDIVTVHIDDEKYEVTQINTITGEVISSNINYYKDDIVVESQPRPTATSNVNYNVTLLPGENTTIDKATVSMVMQERLPDNVIPNSSYSLLDSGSVTNVITSSTPTLFSVPDIRTIDVGYDIYAASNTLTINFSKPFSISTPTVGRIPSVNGVIIVNLSDLNLSLDDTNIEITITDESSMW